MQVQQIVAEIAGIDNGQTLAQRFRDAGGAIAAAKRQIQESRITDARAIAAEIEGLAAALAEIEDCPQKAACEAGIEIADAIEGRVDAENQQKQKVRAEMKAVQKTSASRVAGQRRRARRTADRPHRGTDKDDRSREPEMKCRT
jgi:hypothetical protein